jgi:hypothetical protein
MTILERPFAQHGHAGSGSDARDPVHLFTLHEGRQASESNAMALWHRFRLWRIDAHRVRAESAIVSLFGPGVTVGEIGEMAPVAAHATPAGCAQVEGVIDRLARLPAPVAVGGSAHGSGDGVPLSGVSYRRPAARIAGLPRSDRVRRSGAGRVGRATPSIREPNRGQAKIAAEDVRRGGRL